MKDSSEYYEGQRTTQQDNFVVFRLMSWKVVMVSPEVICSSKTFRRVKGLNVHQFAAFFLEYLKQWRIRHTSAYYIRFSVFFFLCATFTAGESMAMRLWFMVKCLWNMIRVQMLSDLIIKLLNLVKQLVHWFWKILNENTPRKKTISTYGWRTT